MNKVSEEEIEKRKIIKQNIVEVYDLGFTVKCMSKMLKLHPKVFFAYLLVNKFVLAKKHNDRLILALNEKINQINLIVKKLEK
jgi:hypothetical protein